MRVRQRPARMPLLYLSVGQTLASCRELERLDPAPGPRIMIRKSVSRKGPIQDLKMGLILSLNQVFSAQAGRPQPDYNQPRSSMAFTTRPIATM